MSNDPAEVSTGLGPLRLVQRRHGRNCTKADVFLYLSAHGPLAVKDYSGRPWWIRNTVGRLLIRREAASYESAAGLAGFPRFAGRLSPFSLATEWIDARPLAELADASLPAALFERLHEIVTALHARGIALCDLNHRDVLVGQDGSVHVIDLAAAWRLGARPGRLRRGIFERLRAADLFALARLRARFTGEDRGAVIARADRSARAWHRRARRAKWCWDRLRGAARQPPVDDHWRF